MAKADNKNGFSYTMLMLLTDVQKLPDIREDDCNNEKYRDLQYYFKTIQCIIDLNAPIIDFENDNTELIRESINNKIICNEELFGFTYFISSNPNFDYSWYYLRRKINDFQIFLFDVHTFFCMVLKDINKIILRQSEFKDVHFIFHDLLDVKIIDSPPFVHSTINWEKFNQITKVKKGYFITAIYDEDTLLSFSRNKNAQIDLFLDNLSKIRQLNNKSSTFN